MAPTEEERRAFEPLIAALSAAWRGSSPDPSQRALIAAGAAAGFARAANRWPGIALDAPRFVADVARRLEAGGAALATPDAALALVERLRWPDLYLVCASLEPRISGAQELLDARYVRPISALLATRGYDDSLIDEILSLLRQELWPARRSGRKSALSSYRGLGALDAWLRVIAVRIASKQAKRGQSAEGGAGGDLLGALADANPDAELRYLKQTAGAEVREALGHAYEALAPRQRALLAMRLADGMTPGKIARVYRVHRTTAMRWIEQALASLFQDTRQLLSDHLALSMTSCDSLIGLARSELYSALTACVRDDATGDATDGDTDDDTDDDTHRGDASR